MNNFKKNIHIISTTFSAKPWLKAFPDYQESYLVVNDPLFYGQLFVAKSLDEWISLRQDKQQHMFPDYGPAVWYKTVINNSDVLQQAQSITLWVGSNLEEQVLIPFMVYFMKLIKAEHVPINVIEFKPFPSGRSNAIGLFSEEELKNHPIALRLTPEMIAIYYAVWLAICSDTPDRLVSLVNDSAYNLPQLQKALKALLRRYPSKETGLLNWDFVLLKNIKQQGPSVIRVIGFSMTEYFDQVDGDEDWISDTYLWERIQQMAMYPVPLVSISPKISDNTPFGVYQAHLTAFGEQVLKGEKSAYPTCPIDDWIGGVHLSSAENRLWLYEAGRLLNGAV